MMSLPEAYSFSNRCKVNRRNYTREQSGKGFKARLAVTEKDLEKYLESWDPDGDLLAFYFFQMFS